MYRRYLGNRKERDGIKESANAADATQGARKRREMRLLLMKSRLLVALAGWEKGPKLSL